MGSPRPSTRIQPPPPPPPSPPGEGLDLPTLLLTAAASASAAYVTSKVWAPGALGAAAMSPIIVALVKEALRKPADLMTSAVPSPRALGRRPLRTEPLPDDLTERLDGGAPPPFPPPMADAPAGPVRVYSTRARRLRWRLAVVTGLLGFVVCVVVYTVPEVIAGRSVVSSGHKTTLWGGDRHKGSGGSSTTTTETTTTSASTTPEQTQTVTVPQTVTVAPPTATQPAPTTTTAPPAAGTTTPPAEGTGGQAAPAG